MLRDDFEKLCFEYQLQNSLNMISREKEITYIEETRYYNRLPVIGTYSETKRDRINIGGKIAKWWKDPENKEYVDDFCKKNQIRMSENIRDHHISQHYKKGVSPETYLRQRTGIHPRKKEELKFYYNFSIDNSKEELREIYNKYHSINSENNKIWFKTGEKFYEKVVDSKKIDTIIEYFKLPEVYNPFGSVNWYYVSMSGVGYYDHSEPDYDYRNKTVNFNKLGLKDLSSPRECVGLGFAIAKKVLMHYGINDVELIEKILAYPMVASDDENYKSFSMHFSVEEILNTYFKRYDEDNKTEELQDW